MRNTNVLVTHSTVGRIAHHCGPQCQLAELRRGCCRARVAAVGVGIGVARSFASQPAARHCSSFQRVCLHSTSDAVRWMQPLRGTRKAGAVPEKKALSRCARMAGRLDGRWRWPTGRTEWPSSKKVSDSLARSQDRMSQDDECGGTGEASCWYQWKFVTQTPFSRTTTTAAAASKLEDAAFFKEGENNTNTQMFQERQSTAARNVHRDIGTKHGERKSIPSSRRSDLRREESSTQFYCAFVTSGLDESRRVKPFEAVNLSESCRLKGDCDLRLLNGLNEVCL